MFVVYKLYIIKRPEYHIIFSVLNKERDTIKVNLNLKTLVMKKSGHRRPCSPTY